jgi:hypothetical protein
VEIKEVPRRIFDCFCIEGKSLLRLWIRWIGDKRSCSPVGVTVSRRFGSLASI